MFPPVPMNPLAQAAWEYGLDFASRSAVGNLAGQISNCVFGLTYIAVARRHDWRLSSAAAIGAFFGSTFCLNLVDWRLWPTLAALVSAILIAARLAPMLQGLPGVRFLDANTLPGAVCSPVDGMHMTKEAHRALAQGLYRELTASV